MELLCGVSKSDSGSSKPERRAGWGSAWGRASLGKASVGSLTRGDLDRGRWGSIKRSATLPHNVGASLGGRPRTNDTRAPRSSSPQPHRRHLLPSSTLPTTSTLRHLIHDPYNHPMCVGSGNTNSNSTVMVDDVGEPGSLKRSHTLPVNAMRKAPGRVPLVIKSSTLSSSSSTSSSSSSSCVSSSTVSSAKREGSSRGRSLDVVEIGVPSMDDDTLKRQPVLVVGGVPVVPPSHHPSCDEDNVETDTATDVSEVSSSSILTSDASEMQPRGASVGALMRANSTGSSPFRRTLTLPAGAICRRCPGARGLDGRKLSYLHSKLESGGEEDKENLDTITEPSENEIKDGEGLGTGTDEHSGVGGGGSRPSTAAWLGKRHSTTSTLSGLSRLTSTTTTDEGVYVYSEAGSVTSASVYGSVRGGWSGSSIDEGISVYSAPSLASSGDLSSLGSFYERTGARPKQKTGQGILQKRIGKDEDDEKCNRCQREAGGGGSLTPLRRTRSLRGPRHLPVTPTLLRLLQLGLEQVGGNVGGSVSSSVQRREKPHPPRIDAHRFSRANLEDSGDVELDAILGELCALETQFDFEIASKTTPASTTTTSSVNTPSSGKTTTAGSQIIDKMQPKQQQQQPQQGHYQQLHPQQQRQSHSRSNSGNRTKFEPLNVDVDVSNTTMARTDSPDNDSAFSDNVSMLSSESSASSGASGSAGSRHDQTKHAAQAEQAAKLKAEKIKMALEKIKEANVKKLFIKAFTTDGSTKSLLVDEKMTVVHVTRLLADKNHVRMDPKWAVVEHIPDLYMERIYEDDEMLVENLLLWTRDSKNKLLFLERPDKYDLFLRPEQYILIGSSSQKNSDLDDEGRNTLIEEFFSSTGVGVPEVEGPLFLKSEGKKVWKKYYFVLRASGLYYCPKGKSSRSSKDLVCLTTLEVNQVYYGVGWKKKYKAPSDWCFAIKHPHLQAKSSKYIKYLCAEDPRTLAQWVMGIRIAKSGKRLLENYRALVEDLAQEDIDMLASSRSFSIASMAGQSGSQGPSQATTPSSESRSLDSCLAPSLTPSVVDGDDGGDDAQSSAGSSSQDTPVNTLGRTPVWRQDSLKSGSSSSSSGCLSERSSAGTPTGEHGFESDFPQGTIKRKPSSNPKLPLTSTTRLLVKEVEGEDSVDSPTRGSAVRQSVRRSISEEVNTLRRRNSATQSRSSVSSNSSSNVVNSNVTSPVPQEEEMDSLPLPPPPPELTDPCAMELLPPPPPELLASTLSLNSLPPPPDEASLPPINPEDLMMASITSLPPPPPPSPPKPCSPPHSSAAPPLPAHANVIQSSNTSSAPSPPPHGLPLPPPTTPKPTKPRGPGSPIYGSPVYQAVTPPAVAPKPRRDSNDSATYSSPPYLAELRVHNGTHNGSSPPATTPTSSHNGGWHPDAPLPPPPQSPIGGQPVYAQPQKSPQKKVKRITFLDDVQNIPPTPDSPTSKPPLPRRSDSTRLSIPGRLDSPGSKFTPPRAFLNNLQRVMQKKWQVAQKCKDFDKMPHEVLGFRDPILPSEAERNVGAWIQEHYGSLYENLSPHGSPPQPSNDDAETLQPMGSYTLQPSPPPHAEDLQRLSQTTPCRKKPPPPPPKRSDSTQLSTRQ